MPETMSASFTTLESCLACGASAPTAYLDLGLQPLANDYPAEPVDLPTFPLVVAYCTACSHSQLTVSVDPSRLFRHYLYVSGTTDTLRDYFRDFASGVEGTQGPGLRVLDIASNDGSLLAEFKARGHEVLGVDPAENLVAVAEERGVPTRPEFWTEETADTVGKFDVIVAMNVLAHVPDPLGFLRGVRRALAPGGRAYLQTSQADMFANREFDTVYHEHLSYFSIRSFLALFERAGLRPIDLQKPPVHGTSFLWTCTDGDVQEAMSPRISKLLKAEEAGGWHQFSAYTEFGNEARERAAWVRATLTEQAAAGRRIVGYGAAAKGNTFLNFAGITLPVIFEDNPLKVGRYAPGSLSPIASSEDVSSLNDPICVLVLAWNFADEIIRRVREARGANRGDTAVTYFPAGRLLDL